ncbi:MAG: hypothetical protein V1676_06665 [Candidatus Diapherotrites archaeon]
MQIDRDSLLNAAILIVLFARLFSLAVLPEAAYADSFRHVMISQDIMNYGTLDMADNIDSPLWWVPPPLYYLVFSSVFFLTGLPIGQYIIKILPLFFAVVQLLLFFLVSRKLFAENWKVPFALFAAFPLVIRYGSVNYAENLALIFVLACTLLALRIRDARKPVTLLSLVPLAFCLGALSISKLNGAVLVPFLAAAAYYLLKNGAGKKTAAIFIIFSALLSSAWFAANYVKYGYADRSFYISPALHETGESDLSLLSALPQNLAMLASSPEMLSAGFVQFWDFPPFGLLPEQFLPALVLAFALVVLPLYYALFTGALSAARTKRFFFALGALATAAIAVMVIARTIDLWYFRLLFPIVPFIAILFGYGWLELRKNKTAQRLVFLALMLFALYSFAYTSYTAIYYANDQANSASLYAQIALLPEDAKIAIQPNLLHAVNFISGRDAIWKEIGFSASSATELHAKLLSFGVTHLATVCRKDPWDKEMLAELQSEGKLRLLFRENCSALYGVVK